MKIDTEDRTIWACAARREAELKALLHGATIDEAPPLLHELAALYRVKDAAARALLDNVTPDVPNVTSNVPHVGVENQEGDSHGQ
jgi:hypothetical protein